MSNCTHEEYEPVEARGGFGGLFDIFSNTPVVVANVCLACHEQLPVWWGCEDCETTEGNRKVSESVPKLYLTRPCRRHQGAL